MGNTSVKVGNPNEGLTDMDRGTSVSFNVTKESRKTGKVTNPVVIPNSETVDANKRVTNDPRVS